MASGRLVQPTCGSGDTPKLKALTAYFLAALVLTIGLGALSQHPAETALLLSAESLTPASLVLEGRGETVAVWISGRVARPGRHELARGSMLADLLALGQVEPDAYIEAGKLGYELADLDKIYVPPRLDLSTNRIRINDENLPVIRIENYRAPAGRPSGDRLDINLATVEQLQALPGVGPVLAARIIAHRNQYGPFQSVNGLTQVKGIGPKKFEQIREHLAVR